MHHASQDEDLQASLEDLRVDASRQMDEVKQADLLRQKSEVRATALELQLRTMAQELQSQRDTAARDANEAVQAQLQAAIEKCA